MGELSVRGTRIYWDDRPFYYQGLSFFNALYNPPFNQDDETRRHWLAYYRSWGITALRVWGDWRTTNGWIDEGPDCSLWVYPGQERRNVLYEPEGALNQPAVERLKRLLTIADELKMVIELALFTHYRVYPVSTRTGWLERIVPELTPWRNCIFQVWNEYDDHTLQHVEEIKGIDPQRLVTNSPGGAGVLGSDVENRTLDLLTPHTTRHDADFWEVAPAEVEQLIARYGKPAIDDEPARTGIRDFGGRPDSRTEQHLIHIDRVRACGGYHNYHHDMFQSNYGHPATPPLGIPDAEFSDFHRPIFEHLRELAPGTCLRQCPESHCR
jgi:hypothetical protein